jgi:hypothetical protein
VAGLVVLAVGGLAGLGTSVAGSAHSGPGQATGGGHGATTGPGTAGPATDAALAGAAGPSIASVTVSGTGDGSSGRFAPNEPWLLTLTVWCPVTAPASAEAVVLGPSGPPATLVVQAAPRGSASRADLPAGAVTVEVEAPGSCSWTLTTTPQAATGSG